MLQPDAVIPSPNPTRRCHSERRSRRERGRNLIPPPQNAKRAPHNPHETPVASGPLPLLDLLRLAQVALLLRRAATLLAPEVPGLLGRGLLALDTHAGHPPGPQMTPTATAAAGGVKMRAARSR